MKNLLPRKIKVNAHGFLIHPSQVKLANWIFKTYPETAVHVTLEDDKLRTRYMNLLFGIIKRLYHNPLRGLTEAELTKASKDLSDVKQAGFSVEWLASKLDKVSLEKKSSEDRIQELKQELKSLKLTIKEEKSKLKKKPCWITKASIHISF